MHVFGGFCLFWTIYCFLEPLPLTHALHHPYPTLIYVLACFSHVHMAIRDHVRWFGSTLVHLGGFDVQFEHAIRMHPIYLQRINIFSYCIIMMLQTYLHVGQ